MNRSMASIGHTPLSHIPFFALSNVSNVRSMIIRFFFHGNEEQEKTAAAAVEHEKNKLYYNLRMNLLRSWSILWVRYLCQKMLKEPDVYSNWDWLPLDVTGAVIGWIRNNVFFLSFSIFFKFISTSSSLSWLRLSPLHWVFVCIAFFRNIQFNLILDFACYRLYVCDFVFLSALLHFQLNGTYFALFFIEPFQSKYVLFYIPNDGSFWSFSTVTKLLTSTVAVASVKRQQYQTNRNKNRITKN